MKITAVRPFAVKVAHRNQLIVKIETDAGVHGWGESGLSGREKAVTGALDHFAPLLIGQDPFAIGRIWQELYRSQYFEGGRVLTAAQSAIDIALHDIKGKALGVPVFELLGGRQRDRVPTFATVSAEPGPAMIDEAKRLVEVGWRAIRFVAAGHNAPSTFEPRERIATTATWMVKAREALGDEVVLGVEYHHRLSVAEAASFCQKLPRGTLDFLEEPIRDETPEAYEALRALTDIPFAVGEEFASKWQALPYVERSIHQYNRIDVCNVGGLTEAMKIAGWSEAHYVDMMPHNPLGPICTAATIHFCAAIPNLAWMETFARPGETPGGFSDDSLFVSAPLLDGPCYCVPAAPGLGVDVNEDRLSALAYEPWNAPLLRRRDGSVTNW
jgi:galactonate dehydratase